MQMQSSPRPNLHPVKSRVRKQEAGLVVIGRDFVEHDMHRKPEDHDGGERNSYKRYRRTIDWLIRDF